MRRPLWLRVVIAVWAVWLGAMLAGPPGLHACPVHGDHAAHGMAGMAGNAGGGMPDMAGMPSHSAHHDIPGHQSNSRCTCIGACCSAAPVAPPAIQVEDIATVLPVAPARVALVRDARPTTAAPPHTLPFAIAPPAQA
ncbi:MAG: hypothetical protein ACHQSE_03910 [Gemmatimonadales bacterium]